MNNFGSPGAIGADCDYTARMELHPASAQRVARTQRAPQNSQAKPSAPTPKPSESYTPGSPSREAEVEAKAPPAPPLLPQADQAYLVNTETTPVVIRFDARAIAFFEHIGHTVDLEKAQLVAPNGATQPLDSRVSAHPNMREQYGLLSGEKSPTSNEPWTFRVPGMPGGVFGKPQGVQFVGRENGLSVEYLDHDGQPLPKISSGQVADDFQEFRTPTKVLRRDRYSSAQQLLQPESGFSVATPGEFLRQEPIPGIHFKAPNQQAMEAVKNSFDAVLGRVAQSRSETVDLARLKSFESTFQAMLEKAQSEQKLVDGFAILSEAANDPQASAQLRQIVGPGFEDLQGADLLNAVRTKVQRACPLEIIVIPQGRTAADCVDDASPELAEQLQGAGRAYFHSSDPIAYRVQTGADDLPPQRLFIGEEILSHEKAVKVVLKHELLHVFEHRYANPEELQELKTSFAEAQQFQSLYGSSFSEYLPTISEEFMGAHGPEGPQWVKDQHPRIYRMLSQLMPPNS